MQCLCPKFLFLAKAKENFCFIGAFNCWKREVHAPSKGAKDSILMTIILQKLSNGNNFAVCESVCVCARACACDDYSFIKASTFKPFVHNIQVNLVGLSSENVCVCDAG